MAQASGLPNVQLAGRPTTFDYYRRPSSEAGWIEAVIHRIDARGGMVAVEGWAETSNLAVADLAQRFTDAGVAAIIHTDIDRDGVLTGPNVQASAALAQSCAIPVIVSGGVSSLDDIRAVKAAASSGIAGVISGRAIYDGRLDLKAAIRLLGAA